MTCGSPRSAVLLGLAGPSASGKSTLARLVQDALGDTASLVISCDDYYRDLSHLPVAERAQCNFDHPDALETELLVAHLAALRRGEGVAAPRYDFVHHTRRAKTALLSPAPVVIVEGILTLAVPALRACFDLSVYVDAPTDVCLARRVLRDVQERGRSVDFVIDQILKAVRPMEKEFVLPSREYADLVVTQGEFPARAAEIAADLLLRLQRT